MKGKIISIILIVVFFTGCGTFNLQKQTKMTRTLFLDHSEKENKSIYLQVSNTSGSSGKDMNLKEEIETQLIKKGYTITKTSASAGYSLFVNTLFAGSVKEALALGSALSSGVIGGTGAIASGQGGKDSLVMALAFAVGGATVGSVLEDETFRAIVDVRVEDNRKDGTIHQEETRIFTEAIQMNLKKEEALNYMKTEVSNQIVNIF